MSPSPAGLPARARDWWSAFPAGVPDVDEETQKFGAIVGLRLPDGSDPGLEALKANGAAAVKHLSETEDRATAEERALVLGWFLQIRRRLLEVGGYVETAGFRALDPAGYASWRAALATADSAAGAAADARGGGTDRADGG